MAEYGNGSDGLWVRLGPLRASSPVAGRSSEVPSWRRVFRMPQGRRGPESCGLQGF